MRPPLLLAAISALALSSCFSPGDGQAPPLNHLYFPTGIVLDSVNVDAKGAPRFMYVASSDFDLQYRSSSLASFDLAKIRDLVPVNCNTNEDCTPDHPWCDTNSDGRVPSFFCVSVENGDPCEQTQGQREQSEGDKLLYPGRCRPIDIDPSGGPSLLADTVGIGAFATDVILRAGPQTPNAVARLFLPVRGDATVHWIDLGSDGHLKCGQNGTDDHSCDDAHRAGNNPLENVNQIRQPSEPYGVDASADGEYVAVTNQTTGSVSLYSGGLSSGGPKLESILSGLPTAPVAIAAVPVPALSAAQQGALAPAFLVAYRDAPRIDLLRVGGNDSSDAGHLALGFAGSVPINVNAVGFDSRSLVFDTDKRNADYGQCAQSANCTGLDCEQDPAFLDCARLARQPDVYVANRTPSSLLVGSLSPDPNYLAGSSDLPAFTDNLALTIGPSRVVLGRVRVAAAASDPDAITDDGAPYKLERRVFVVCFDSRRVFIYDPERRVIEARVITGRGPFALAIDDARGLGYISHFTDSYLGVISLDQRFPKSYASIIANIGIPSPPRASK